jgi:hypothetical protein
MNSLNPGENYRHFKGNEYKIICIGKDSETEEEKVVYQDVSDNSKIWIRPIEMFLDTKQLPDGTEVQRFRKVE